MYGVPSRLEFRNFVLLLALGLSACAIKLPSGGSFDRGEVVTATAYASTTGRTDPSPRRGAWGDRLDKLRPGVRAIAVSRDLEKKGLERNRRVRIDKLEGEFVVLDRMPSKWKNRIDIHMDSVAEARRWGKQSVKLSWNDEN